MMKYLAVAAAMMAAPALAQPAPAAQDHSMHAGHTAPAADNGAAQAKPTLDTPIEALMANAKAKAVVEESMPGVEGHPAYDQFKAMSLRQVQPYSNGMITDEMLAKIEAGLNAIEG